MNFGFSLQDSYQLPMSQAVELVAEAGFCAISPGWQRDGDWKKTVRHARTLGLTVQSLHGPLRGMPAMWSPDPDTAQSIREDLLQSAADCGDMGIPLLVVHPWNGMDYTFREDALCFAHFDALVEQAVSHGISIAFENLEGPEFLAALLDRYADCKNVGFCWDSGHEMCYAPGQDLLRRYGHRLMMTHLNDNLGVTDPNGHLQGTDDLHLFPGDGTADWADILRRLKNAAPQKILNLELKIRPKGDRCKLDLYSAMALPQYFREAFQTARDTLSAYFL